MTHPALALGITVGAAVLLTTLAVDWWRLMAGEDLLEEWQRR